MKIGATGCRSIIPGWKMFFFLKLKSSKMDIIKIRFQTCNLCDAMIRNINDNFISVSFDFIKNAEIVVKIILKKRTQIEDEFIEDMIAEFSALQQTDCVTIPKIELGNNHL